MSRFDGLKWAGWFAKHGDVTIEIVPSQAGWCVLTGLDSEDGGPIAFFVGESAKANAESFAAIVGDGDPPVETAVCPFAIVGSYRDDDAENDGVYVANHVDGKEGVAALESAFGVSFKE